MRLGGYEAIMPGCQDAGMLGCGRVFTGLLAGNNLVFDTSMSVIK